MSQMEPVIEVRNCHDAPQMGEAMEEIIADVDRLIVPP